MTQDHKYDIKYDELCNRIVTLLEELVKESNIANKDRDTTLRDSDLNNMKYWILFGKTGTLDNVLNRLNAALLGLDKQ